MVNFKYDWFVQTNFNILSQKTLRPIPSMLFQVQCAQVILHPTLCSQCYWERLSISNRPEQNRMQCICRSWAERRVISGFRWVSVRPSFFCGVTQSRLVVTGVSGQPVGPVYMRIRPVGAELFHADGQTDMKKLMVAFRNFANAPKHNTKCNRNKTRLETCGRVVF